MVDKKPGFSIIIPTYNADQELSLALTSLKKNSLLNNQIIVVVDRLKEGGVSEEVLAVLNKHQIKPIVNQENLGPYKNWNLGAQKATKDWLVFATDDQYFAPGWDQALWDFKRSKRLLTGQLVEPGIIPVWETNIKKDFGHNPQEFRAADFEGFAQKAAVNQVADDGFFIPMVLSKADFTSLGFWPTAGDFGTRNAPANDIAFVNKAKEAGFEFKRALNSFSYHFQGSSWRRKNLATGISVVVISRPQEDKIYEVLDSVNDWSDEIILVIDSKKAGNVVQAGKKFGAKIYYRPFDDYSSQKNFAISKAKGDWILSLDADEVVSSTLADELQKASQDLSYNGYYLPRQNIIFGQVIRHTGWYPDHQLRFFVKGYGQFNKIIHERISVRGSVGYLKGPLVHYNYQTVSDFVSRLNGYTSAEAEQLTTTGYKFSSSDLFYRPIEEFLRRFFAHEGWKDGLHGLALSLLMAFYTLVIYLKVWEMAGFTKEPLPDRDFVKSIRKEISFWWQTFLIENENNWFKKTLYRLKRKISSK